MKLMMTTMVVSEALVMAEYYHNSPGMTWATGIDEAGSQHAELSRKQMVLESRACPDCRCCRSWLCYHPDIFQ